MFILRLFLLHASSYNALNVPRIITNPFVYFSAPMKFDRVNYDDQTPVEKAILRALGKKNYDFQTTVPRPMLTPDRIAQQAKLKAEE